MSNPTKLLTDAKRTQILMAGKLGVLAVKAEGLKRRSAYNESPHYCLHCQTPILAPLDASAMLFQQIKEKRFCSRSCSAKYSMGLNTSPRHKPKIRTCSVCSQEYIRPQGGNENRCSACIGKIFISLLTKKKSECSIQVIRKHARIILRRLGYASCQICGYTHRVDCCHIKPIKTFPPTALIAEINARGNLAALCPNHHIELDLGILKMVGDGSYDIPTPSSQS